MDQAAQIVRGQFLICSTRHGTQFTTLNPEPVAAACWTGLRNGSVARERAQRSPPHKSNSKMPYRPENHDASLAVSPKSGSDWAVVFPLARTRFEGDWVHVAFTDTYPWVKGLAFQDMARRVHRHKTSANRRFSICTVGNVSAPQNGLQCQPPPARFIAKYTSR